MLEEIKHPGESVKKAVEEVLCRLQPKALSPADIGLLHFWLDLAISDHNGKFEAVES
jgi:hypothetical protein